MVLKDAQELYPVGAEEDAGVPKPPIELGRICWGKKKMSLFAVSPDGLATVLLTPENRIEEVTFSPPPENTGVRRACWNPLKFYPVLRR